MVNINLFPPPIVDAHVLQSFSAQAFWGTARTWLWVGFLGITPRAGCRGICSAHRRTHVPSVQLLRAKGRLTCGLLGSLCYFLGCAGCLRLDAEGLPKLSLKSNIVN